MGAATTADEKYLMAAWGMELALQRIVREESQGPGEAALQEECLTALHALAQSVCPSLAVLPYGSGASGLAGSGSDLDVSICRLRHLGLPMAEVQARLGDLLQEGAADFELVQDLRFANVPLLRLCYLGVLDVDLSFENHDALRNTQFLRAYSFISPRVRDLVLVIKRWAKAAGVVGAQHGNLSSYSLTLLAVYYMQVDEAVNLPCLDTSLFDGGPGLPDGLLDTQWQCPLGTADLACRFFQFYARVFQHGDEVVSVRSGRRAFVSEGIFAGLRGASEKRLHVEDPFILTRNLNCVLLQDREGALAEHIGLAASACDGRVLPAGLAAWASCQMSRVQLPQLPPPAVGVSFPTAEKRRQPEPPQLSADGGDSTADTSTPDVSDDDESIGSPSEDDVPIPLLHGATWRL